MIISVCWDFNFADRSQIRDISLLWRSKDFFSLVNIEMRGRLLMTVETASGSCEKRPLPQIRWWVIEKFESLYSKKKKVI